MARAGIKYSFIEIVNMRRENAYRKKLIKIYLTSNKNIYYGSLLCYGSKLLIYSFVYAYTTGIQI